MRVSSGIIFKKIWDLWRSNQVFAQKVDFCGKNVAFYSNLPKVALRAQVGYHSQNNLLGKHSWISFGVYFVFLLVYHIVRYIYKCIKLYRDSLNQSILIYSGLNLSHQSWKIEIPLTSKKSHSPPFASHCCCGKT